MVSLRVRRRYPVGVLGAAVMIALVSAVVVLSRRYGATGPVRTCCSTARWPPDDLTDPHREASTDDRSVAMVRRRSA
jgi:hypothetical protein